VPQGRQRIARPWFGIVAVKRGGERCNRERRDRILGGVFAADPGAQMVDIY